MIYSHWGGKADTPLVSKLGFGTTRFSPEDLHDAAGLRRCGQLVEHALEKGINYFDVSPTYSYGYAEKILGEVFRRTDQPLYVAGKTGLSIDRTADQLLKRLDNSLSVLHRKYIDFFHIWSVMNLEQYREVMRPDGLYEGATKAKEQGLIRNLCISLHTSADEALRIIEDCRFDGITISMNAINYEQWLPVIRAAKKKDMGVSTMNSLAGGIIPRYKSLFETLDNTTDSVPVKALRFLASFPEIDVLLSGMTSLDQIDENCSAFEQELPVTPTLFQLKTTQSLCSGCNYCSPCTVGIPIAACM